MEKAAGEEPIRYLKASNMVVDRNKTDEFKATMLSPYQCAWMSVSCSACFGVRASSASATAS